MPAELGAKLAAALHEQLIAMADDELVLGHRDSEWCGRAPILEEDIAFANMALDEIGHARTWYGLAARLVSEDESRYPDQMVFRRPTASFRCMQMVELPNTDWAFSMLRQYLFDAAETVRLAELRQSRYTPLAEAALRIQKEEIYHYRHTQAWVQRLGLGTEESHGRMQKALDELWGHANQMWQPLPGEELLVAADYTAPTQNLERIWLDKVIPVLRVSELSVPELAGPSPSRQDHTPHLDLLVNEMQSLVRLDPLAEW